MLIVFLIFILLSSFEEAGVVLAHGKHELQNLAAGHSRVVVVTVVRVVVVNVVVVDVVVVVVVTIVVVVVVVVTIVVVVTVVVFIVTVRFAVVAVAGAASTEDVNVVFVVWEVGVVARELEGRGVRLVQRVPVDEDSAFRGGREGCMKRRNLKKMWHL